jgi:hypothetical protein
LFTHDLPCRHTQLPSDSHAFHLPYKSTFYNCEFLFFSSVFSCCSLRASACSTKSCIQSTACRVGRVQPHLSAFLCGRCAAPDDLTTICFACSCSSVSVLCTLCRSHFLLASSFVIFRKPESTAEKSLSFLSNGYRGRPSGPTALTTFRAPSFSLELRHCKTAAATSGSRFASGFLSSAAPSPWPPHRQGRCHLASSPTLLCTTPPTPWVTNHVRKEGERSTKSDVVTCNFDRTEIWKNAGENKKVKICSLLIERREVWRSGA